MNETVPSEVYDDRANRHAAVREKLIDALTPGIAIEFDPEEAEIAGAFREDALSDHDADESVPDLEAALLAFQNPVRAASTLAAAMLDAGHPTDSPDLKGAITLLTGLILHTSLRAGPITASTLSTVLSMPLDQLARIWEQMSLSTHVDPKIRRAVGTIGADFAAMPFNEAATIVGTAKQQLSKLEGGQHG